MRFLVDESVGVRLAIWLNDHGHDATAVARDYPQSLPDDDVLAIADLKVVCSLPMTPTSATSSFATGAPTLASSSFAFAGTTPPHAPAGSAQSWPSTLIASPRSWS